MCCFRANIYFFFIELAFTYHLTHSLYYLGYFKMYKKKILAIRKSDLEILFSGIVT